MEQSSTIEILVGKKEKKKKIYRRIRNAFGKAKALVKKIFTNEMNMSLPLEDRVETAVHGVETHWVFKKRVFLAERSIKKARRTVFYEMKGHVFYWFL